MSSDTPTILLDGSSLTIESVAQIAKGNCKIEITEQAWERIQEGREIVSKRLQGGDVCYGINTGFGNFANVVIPSEKLQSLQQNLIRSHAAGVGDPLPPSRARVLLALRINVLCKGNSGIRPETVKLLLGGWNLSCYPFVPDKGTVGASGDLAPLAHLALGFMGEGRMWDSENECWGDAAKVLAKKSLTPITLEAKEGLALINGTQLICTFATEACFRARRVLHNANIIAALTLEGLKGTHKAFFDRIHEARPHPGQIWVAKQLRSLLHSDDPGHFTSQIYESHRNCNKVQDSYTLRCIPQVHGVTFDTLEFVERVITTEINSATDNPMVFADIDRIVSGGNFHGEYPAKMCDYLSIGINELANISERRTERLVNPNLSDLPAFLVKEGGLNSGFMIAHCTAAALTSENKSLMFPASSDTISTSASKEDHVSMGGWAARKAVQVVSNVEVVLAIELLCAVQAIDFHRPLRTTEPLERVHSFVRERISNWDCDRNINPDIEAAIEIVRSGALIKIIEPYWKNDQ